MNSGPKWTEIWKLFDADEQHDACICLIENFIENWDSSIARRVLKRVAEGTGSRRHVVESMARAEPAKLARIIRTRATALLDEESWGMLFKSYYPKRKTGLLCAFLDQVGIEHDEKGAAKSDSFTKPSQAVVATAVANLLRSYTTRELVRYLAVVARHARDWDFVAEERDRLLQLIDGKGTADERSATSQAESASASSMEFTVLDRVLIEQVVRAAMQIEGSLDAMQVEELIQTTARLSDKWYRAHFHLGFMDVLLPGRTLQFDRPGDNQQRRGWYLAGVVAGLVRSHDTDELRKVFDERADDLSVVVAEPGGPGGSIAVTAFRRLLEVGRVADGVKILRGQLTHLGLDFANEALEIATLFIRQSNFEAAKVIVDELSRHSLSRDGEEDLQDFRLELSRRRAQCLQAAGNFEGAEREYRELLPAGEDRNSPDLLADLGLVKGRFRTLAEVRVPEGTAARVAMRESLTKGEEFYKRAAERFGTDSPKAAYPLAVLGYLRWTIADSKDREQRREKAAELASAAVSAILVSEFSAVYRDFGALGQSQFMLAVTRMNSFEDVQGREALVAWQTITSEAGRFPVEDLKRLIDATDMYGADIADAIAESIWDYRRDDAVDVLKDGPWMTRSSRLRAELISMAKRELTPRVDRIRIWMLLIPLLIKGGDLPDADEGLGELERLAETDSDFEKVLEFLLTRSNYDPAWREAEAGMSRVYLLRRLGRDNECTQELRRIFYQARDSQRWEADQILIMFDEWGLDSALRNELWSTLPKKEVEERLDVGDRLRAGEHVRIVFIGGNEVQAQYDKSVQELLANEWPGVSVHFEHTGWSSNWGKDLPRLTGLANGADVVVLMPMMRTTLGRRIRAALKAPWISCTSTGKGGMLMSLRQAARLIVEIRLGGPVPR